MAPAPDSDTTPAARSTTSTAPGDATPLAAPAAPAVSASQPAPGAGPTRVQRAGFWVGLTLFLGLALLWVPDVAGAGEALASAGLAKSAAALDARMIAVAAGIAALMAAWWMTEALPIPVTSLVPLVLLPLGGVLKFKAVAPFYANHNIFLFLGGFLIAIAIERCGLHRRIALAIVALVGSSPRRLVLGFMLATAAISMWISNTATVMMMLPIAMALIDRFERDADPKWLRTFSVALLLGVAYAGSIGGIGTLIGTPPNLSFSAIFSQTFPAGSGAPEITFASWLGIGIPIVVVMLPIAWVVLCFVVCRIGAQAPARRGAETAQASDAASAGNLLTRERAALGPMSVAERRVLVIFVLTALLWAFRKPIVLGDALTIHGWSELLPAAIAKNLHDGWVAIGMAVLLFILPSGIKRTEPSGAAIRSSDEAPAPPPMDAADEELAADTEASGTLDPTRLLDWPTAQRRVPWGILLLFGGGFALARGIQASGLSLYVGAQFSFLAGAPPLVIIAVAALVLTFLTEVTSNTATAEVTLPLVAGIAVTSVGINPLVLMVPVTVAASCAFMMPVATPPNAIVFASGRVPMRKMIAAGIWLNLIGVVVVAALVWALLPVVFGVDFAAGVPTWALPTTP